MFKHRIVIETNSPEELARKLLVELKKLAQPQVESKIEVVNNNLTCQMLLSDGTMCNAPATERKGINKYGKPYHGIFCMSNPEHKKWITEV